MHRMRSVLVVIALVLMTASAMASSLPPIQPVAHVDLPRFMGKWYLIATIPTSYGKNAYDAVETYTLKPDGNIHTTFSFHEGGFDGPCKHIESTAYVRSGTGNAEWGVQVFGLFKMQYIVAWLKPDYSQMIVARDKRDYVWVFARSPGVQQSEYDKLVARVRELGYSISTLRKVPQGWPSGLSPAHSVATSTNAE